MDRISLFDYKKVNWEIFRVFLEVTEYKNLSEAAENLNSAQKTLKNQLIQLEEILGKSLFIRSDKNYMSTKLTPDGIVFKKKLHKFKSIIFSDKKIDFDDEERFDEITVYTTPGLSNLFLPKMIKTFWESHPNIAITVRPTETPRKLVSNEIQIRNNFWPQKNLEKEHLFDLHSSFYASKSYIKENGNPRTVSELKEHRKFFSPSSVETIHTMQKEYYTPPVLISYSFDLSLYLCKEGLGIISSPDIVVEGENLEKVLTKEKIPTQEIFLGWIEDGREDSPIKKFLKSLRGLSAKDLLTPKNK